jgi:hypothetical protein
MISWARSLSSGKKCAKGAARLCIAARADETLIPQWMEEGRRRTANARKRPYTGFGQQRVKGAAIAPQARRAPTVR